MKTMNCQKVKYVAVLVIFYSFVFGKWKKNFFKMQTNVLLILVQTQYRVTNHLCNEEAVYRVHESYDVVASSNW